VARSYPAITATSMRENKAWLPLGTMGIRALTKLAFCYIL